MARSGYNDPLSRFSCTMWIYNPYTGQSEITRAGASFVSGVNYKIRSKKYAEGGRRLFPRNIKVGGSFEPITLRRGVFIDLVREDVGYFEWIKAEIETETLHHQGNTEDDTSKIGNLASQTPFRHIIINHHNDDGSIAVQWILYWCRPVSFSGCSDFDALAEDAVSYEEITFEFEECQKIKPELSLDTIRRFL